MKTVPDRRRMIDPRGVLRRSLVVLAASILLVAIALARDQYRQISGSFFVSDGFGYYIYLPSLLIDRDLDLANQLLHQDDQINQRWYDRDPTTGRIGNAFQVGCALLWSPFFLATHALNSFWNDPTHETGFGWHYELPVYYGAFLYALSAILLIHLF